MTALLWWRLPLGLLLALAMGLTAFRKGSLAPGGVLGATLVGGTVFGFGGLPPGLALVAFFLSASFLSHWRAAEKQAAAVAYAKGGRRDLGQALANGGVAAAAAVWAFWHPTPAGWAACVGAVAAAAADTWATETGALARTPPRLITTWRRVPAGASGGVTPLGLMAAIAGALLVGGVAAGVWSLGAAPPWPIPGGGLSGSGAAAAARWLAAVVAGGVAGSLADSLLGALAQGIWWCPTCQREVEVPRHRCGTRTQHRRGLPWLGNDLVNLLATLAGAAVAGVLAA